MKSKKGGVSIAILLLVALTLTLVISSLVLFTTRDINSISGFSKILLIENVEIQENIVDVNIQLIVNRAARKSTNKEEFLENLKIELLKYKIIHGEYILEDLESIEDQLIIENILEDGSGINLEILIEKEFESFNVEYSYTKTFINN